MKITSKHLRIVSGFLLILGAVLIAIRSSYNQSHPDDAYRYLRWTGIGLMIVAIILQAPWIKDDEKK
ncbi:MAG: hypothetical protein R2744_13425 [Bacteroidales bacterium]